MTGLSTIHTIGGMGGERGRETNTGTIGEGTPVPGQQALPENENAADAKSDIDLFTILAGWCKEDTDHSHEWRREARESYDMVAGHQWSAEDANWLKLNLRPIITFNRISSVVDSVAGLEIGNRQETQYLPRQVGQTGVNELLSGAAKWIRDECDAEDEESDSFVDLIVTGLGVTETRVDYDQDPDGKMLIERVDPMEMYWDGSATKRNLGDARRIFRIRDVSAEVAEDMFPDKTLDEINAGWAEDTGANSREPHDAQMAPFYRYDQSGLIDKSKMKVKIVEAQWWQHEKVVRTKDPMTGKPETFSQDEFAKLRARLAILRRINPQEQAFADPPYVIQKRRKYFRAFLGSELLKKLDGPKEGGFTYKFMTGKRDRNKGFWFGLVRAMMDPQRWANKWLSQTLHVINVNAKGGIFAEPDAFDNPQDAMDNYADPASITLTAPGALTGGKIKDKPQMAMPTGTEKLMQFAVQSIRDASGVNLELLGMVDREQPGVLEDKRKQAGMTILAGLFDSLRRYRKEQGRLMLYYITEYLSDGRLVKIGGTYDAKYIPLVRQPDTVRYDVIVDEAPTSVNMKEKTWAIMTQLLPFLKSIVPNVPPEVVLEIMRYSPLPDGVVNKMEMAAAKASQQPPPPNPEMIMSQANMTVAQAKARNLDADTALKGVDRQLEAGKLQSENMRSVAEARADQIDQATALAKIESLRAGAAANLAKAGATQTGIGIDKFNALIDAISGLVGAHVDLKTANQPQPPKAA